MPLYEYECQSCHRRVEKIKLSSSAPPETICPHCGGPLVQSLSAPAVQFKGSGWYVTDYAKSGAPPKKSSDSSASKDSGGDAPSSSDKTAASSASAEQTASAPAKTETAAAPKASTSGSAKSE
jgi:putative FmdB family regulatory protein